LPTPALKDVIPNRAEGKSDVIPNWAESPVRNLLFAYAATHHCHCKGQQVPRALSARIGMTRF